VKRQGAAPDHGHRRAELTAWRAEGSTFFRDRILQIDCGVAAVGANFGSATDGWVGVVDALTAATASPLDLVVVTAPLSFRA
jgi:hypothetical protein